MGVTSPPAATETSVPTQAKGIGQADTNAEQGKRNGNGHGMHAGEVLHRHALGIAAGVKPPPYAARGTRSEPAVVGTHSDRCWSKDRQRSCHGCGIRQLHDPCEHIRNGDVGDIKGEEIISSAQGHITLKITLPEQLSGWSSDPSIGVKSCLNIHSARCVLHVHTYLEQIDDLACAGALTDFIPKP